jgi:hypothetical protein
MVERLARAAVTTPWNDVLAPGDYRRQISGAVAARAVAELLKGAA